MRIRCALVLMTWILVACAGCGRSASPTAGVAKSTGAGEPGPAVKTYKLVGVVREVDPKAGVVTIRHEAIPGFMEAMTMPFTLKDRAVLDDLHPGDAVEGSLRVEMEHDLVRDYELIDLAVTRPALASGPVEEHRLLEPGQMVPDFTVTTQEGRSLALSELRGDVVVLTFIYTRCPLPDFCPLIDRKFAELADKLSVSPALAGRVRLLSVSFDPEHDTPEVLREHARVRGARPPLWTFAVASHAELAKVAGPLGLVYAPRPDEIAHNLCTAVIDPRGRLARLDVGAAGRRWTPSDLLKTIHDASEASRG